jgi:hypothetical protein
MWFRLFLVKGTQVEDKRMFPVRRSDVVVREIEGETLVLDGQTGKVHQFNSTAGFIWACCDGVSSVIDITSRLAAVYNIPVASVAPDVANTIGKFQELGLLVASRITKLSERG